MNRPPASEPNVTVSSDHIEKAADGEEVGVEETVVGGTTKKKNR